MLYRPAVASTRLLPPFFGRPVAMDPSAQFYYPLDLCMIPSSIVVELDLTRALDLPRTFDYVDVLSSHTQGAFSALRGD